MYWQQKEYGKHVFGHTVPEPPKPQGFGEENVLQVTHVARREEKELVIEFEDVVLLCRRRGTLGKYIEDTADGRCLVDLGDDIERACGVEDEDRLVLQRMELFEHTPDGTVSAVDDDVVVAFDVVMFRQLRCIDMIDGEPVVCQHFADGENAHLSPLSSLAIIIAMKIESEAALDELIICHKCHTVHKEVPIKDGAKACCSECGSVLYRYDSKLIDHGLALSTTALIFFFLANLFPLVKIEILGHTQYITLTKTFLSLFENGFYIVGMLCLFLIFLFPLLIMLLYLFIFALLKFKGSPQLLKEMLVLLSHLKPWSMSEIFLVSIFVALVKLIGYAQIHMGISFWALAAFVLLDIYLNQSVHISEIWMLRKRHYGNEECINGN